MNVLILFTNMNIGASELIEMIEDELNTHLSEANLYHDPKTGHWSSKKAGNVYSLTKKGAKNAPNSEVGKGIVTGKGNVKAKYGMADQCGRMKLSGDDINPEYSCSKFKQKYDEDILSEPEVHKPVGEIEVIKIGNKTYINLDSLISQADDDELLVQEDKRGQAILKKCNSYGLYTRRQVLDNFFRQVNAMSLSSDGKYLQPINKKG